MAGREKEMRARRPKAHDPEGAPGLCSGCERNARTQSSWIVWGSERKKKGDASGLISNDLADVTQQA